MVNCKHSMSTGISKLPAALIENNKGIELLKRHDPDGLQRDSLMLGDGDFYQSLRVRSMSLELTKHLGRLSVEDEDMDLISDACHEVFDRCTAYWGHRALSGHDPHVWLQCDPDDEFPDWGPKFEDGSSVYIECTLKAYDFEVLDWVVNPLWISCMVLPDPEKKVANVMKTAGFSALQGLLAVKPMSYIELTLNEKLNDFLLSVQAAYSSYGDSRLGCQKAFCDAVGVSDDVWMQDEECFDSWKADFIREQQPQRDELFLRQLYVIEDRQHDFKKAHELLRQYHYNGHMSDPEINSLGKSLAGDPRLKCLLHHTLFQMADFSPAILKLASNGRMFLFD